MAAIVEENRQLIATQGEVSVDKLLMVVLPDGTRGVDARLFNQSQKKLIKAQVDIRFLRSSGAVLLTRSVNPLVVSGGLFGDQSEPLKAGESRQFTIMADDVPSGWTGHMDAKVSALGFAPVSEGVTH